LAAPRTRCKSACCLACIGYTIRVGGAVVSARTYPETKILRAVRCELERAGWYVLRQQQGLGCVKGVADLVALRDGRTCWLEIKSQTGRQTPDQVAFERAIVAHGGEYLLIRGVDDLAAAGLIDCLVALS
jgi:hypothetical protein